VPVVHVLCMPRPPSDAHQVYAHAACDMHYGVGCQLNTWGSRSACHCPSSVSCAAASCYALQPEVTLGVIPGIGGTQRLSRLVGRARAVDAMLTASRCAVLHTRQNATNQTCQDCRAGSSWCGCCLTCCHQPHTCARPPVSAYRISAEEALSAGLVSRVVAPEQLLPEAHKIADKLARWALAVLHTATHVNFMKTDTSVRDSCRQPQPQHCMEICQSAWWVSTMLIAATICSC
jgi:hypothetical protein